MLSIKERKYLKNIVENENEHYGHYPRILRYRIRKKIRTMLNDLMLLQLAEFNFRESKHYHSGFEHPISSKQLISPISHIDIKDKRKSDDSFEDDVVFTLKIPYYEKWDV